MCNIWSVLEYPSKAKEDDFKYEWQHTGYTGAFRFPVIMQKIKKCKNFNVEDVLTLVNIIGNVELQNVECSYPDLFSDLFLSKAICHL
ncbi:unnamed protein product [Tenebrio molitor]|nr:unnamed protein product [Tenebrio molitor]